MWSKSSVFFLFFTVFSTLADDDPLGTPEGHLKYDIKKGASLSPEYEAVGYHCVPYYSCNECDVIITDGGDLFDPRDSQDTCKTSRKY